MVVSSQDDANPNHYYDETVKVAVAGPEGAGKSCLVASFLDGVFAECVPTIGVDFKINSTLIDGRATRFHM